MPSTSDAPRAPLILASTSRYRAELLARLGLEFEPRASGVDERERSGETPESRARRLSIEKARAVARQRPGSWVIGSDQVACCGGSILHQPGTLAANVEQLLALSGREAAFVTGVALVGEGFAFDAVDVTTVRFRLLDRSAIARYVAAEPAPDCAGGFKIEGLGITLFEEVRCTDPSALIGLPLISLRRLLSQAGLDLP